MKLGYFAWAEFWKLLWPEAHTLISQHTQTSPGTESFLPQTLPKQEPFITFYAPEPLHRLHRESRSLTEVDLPRAGMLCHLVCRDTRTKPPPCRNLIYQSLHAIYSIYIVQVCLIEKTYLELELGNYSASHSVMQ